MKVLAVKIGAAGVGSIAFGLAVAACSTGQRYDDVMIHEPEPTASATADVTAQPTTEATATATASSAPDAPASTKLSVRGAEVDVDKAKGTVSWHPDRGVQRASYTHYVFKYDEYAKAVGAANLEKDAEVEATCTETIEKPVKPSDPKLPTPVGGFENHVYECTIVRATTAK